MGMLYFQKENKKQQLSGNKLLQHLWAPWTHEIPEKTKELAGLRDRGCDQRWIQTLELNKSSMNPGCKTGMKQTKQNKQNNKTALHIKAEQHYFIQSWAEVINRYLGECGKYVFKIPNINEPMIWVEKNYFGRIFLELL